MLGSSPGRLAQTFSPGLAAGHITMLVFGDETRDYFLVIGQAVEDVRLAQNMAQMNDVILSPNCWQLCDRSMVEIERIPDQRAVKVRMMLPLAEGSAGLSQTPGSQKPPGRRCPRRSPTGRSGGAGVGQTYEALVWAAPPGGGVWASLSQLKVQDSGVEDFGV